MYEARSEQRITANARQTISERQERQSWRASKGGWPSTGTRSPACARAIKELARLATKAKSETARVVAIRELLDRGYGKPAHFVGGDENAGPINNHIRVSFVKPDGTEVDDLDEAIK